jgi:anaerobic selenocysteine-containing dehydrogenase
MKRPGLFAATHHVATVCPLDCPDSCSLTVTVQDSKVTTIDGSSLHPVTGGFICAKVRRFPERLYGADRLEFPAIRRGPKGSAKFERVSWDSLPTSSSRRGMRGAENRSSPTRMAARTVC